MGLFLLVALAATLGVLFTMTDAAMFRGRYVVTTHVPDAGGIRRGDPVQMRGVNIGRVMGFEIGEKGVAIRLEIEGEYAVPADSQVELRSAGLLGGMVANVVPGRSARRLRYGDTLAGGAQEPVLDATQRLVDRAGGAMDRLDSLLSDSFVKDLHAGGAELRALSKSLSDAVKEQRLELRALEASLRKNSEGLERVTAAPELDRAMQRLDVVSERAERIAESLNRSSAAAEDVLGRLQRGDGTLGKLSKDEQLYGELSDAARSIREAGNDFSALVEDIKKNPKRYLKLSLF